MSKLILHTLTCVELTHGGGGDEIEIRLSSDVTSEQRLGEYHIDKVGGGANLLGFSISLNTSATVWVFDNDRWSGDDQIGAVAVQNSNTDGIKTLVFKGSPHGGNYLVTYEVK